MLNNAKAEFSTRRHIEKLTEALEKDPELDTRATEAGIPLAWMSLIAETEEEIRKHPYPEKIQTEWYAAQKGLKKILRRLYSESDEKAITATWEKEDRWDKIKAGAWETGMIICFGGFLSFYISIRQGQLPVWPDALAGAFVLLIGGACAYKKEKVGKKAIDREKEKTVKEVLRFMETSG